VWQHAIKRAGIPACRFHDLRHTAAPSLAMDGASPLEIAEILGHKTLSMVKRYAHLSESHTRSVVARMHAAGLGE
jgi:site-specific recombinase XerD